MSQLNVKNNKTTNKDMFGKYYIFIIKKKKIGL